MYSPPAAPAARRRGAGLAAHLVWEGVLLMVTAAVGVVLLLTPEFDLGQGILWSQLARVGFVASGLALSLRTATPNLAVGVLAVLAGWAYAELVQAGWAAPVAAAVSVLVVAAVGAAMGAVAGLLTAPAWAVTLGATAAVQAVLYGLGEGRSTSLQGNVLDTSGTVLCALAFVAVSLAGGVAWQFRGVRDRFAANRAPVDPVAWRSSRFTGALVGLTGSSLLAGVGGVVGTAILGSSFPFDSGVLLPAIGAVLLGGVSVYGRRGGVAGTVLGVALVSLLTIAVTIQGWSVAFILAVPALAVLVGLVVSRVLEAVAGPAPSGVPAQPPQSPLGPAFAAAPYDAPPGPVGKGGPAQH